MPLSSGRLSLKHKTHGRTPAFAAMIAAATLCASAAGAAETAGVKTYRATIDNVKYVYATVPPVAHLQPGDVLDTNTLDAAGNALQKPGDTFAMVKGDNPLTGPFYIEGAAP